MRIVVRIPQTVVHHQIDDVAFRHRHAITGTGFRQGEGRVGHAFHAARHDDVGVTEHDFVGAELNGLQARPTHLVDGEAGDGSGDTRAQGRLTSGSLAESTHEHVAHDDLLHLLRFDSGAFDDGADGDAAQFDGFDGRQRTQKNAHRRACGCDDYDVTHSNLLDFNVRVLL